MRVEEITISKEATEADNIKCEFYQMITNGEVHTYIEYLQKFVNDPLKVFAINKLKP